MAVYKSKEILDNFKPLMVETKDGSLESLEQALRKFKKKVESSRRLDEYGKRQFFVKPSLAKREKRKARLKYG